MGLSINSKTAIAKLCGVTGILCVASFAGLWLSIPIPLVYKLGLFFLPLVVLVIFTVEPLWILSLIFLLRPEFQLFRTTTLKFFSGLVIVFAFITITSSREKFDFCWDNLKYLYVFVLISLISIIYTINHKESVIAILRILSYMSIYLLTFNLVKSQADGIKLLSCFPLAAVAPILFGCYQKASGYTYIEPTTGIERFNSFFSLANGFSYFLFVIFLASIPLFQYIKSKRNKVLLAILLIWATITMGWLGVRAVWVLMTFSLVVISFFLPKIRKYILILVPVLLVLLSGVIGKGVKTIVNPNVHSRYGDSFYWRLDEWDRLINNAIVKKPILGFGTGTSQEVSATYAGFDLVPHNDYLRVLAEVGIIGFIPYILFFSSNLISSYKNIYRYKENGALNVCAFTFWGVFLIAMMGSNVFYSMTFTWYLFGYLATANKLNLITQLT